MTRRMYDGVASDAAAIGHQAQPGDLVGGYGDGMYAWSAADWANIAPGVIRVLIVVFATTNTGVILDCEPGNATPAESVDWVLMRRAAGADPTVYMSVSNWPAVRAAFQSRGVPEPHYWVAAYDNVQVIPPGAVGKQYADNLLLGQPWDESVVADYWPGIDPAPADPPAPNTRRNDMNIQLQAGTANGAPGEPVVAVNPAAVLGGTGFLTLAADFADAVVRVAVFSLSAAQASPGAGWSVVEKGRTIGRTAGAYKLTLPPDTNKVSVQQLSSTGTVGLDIFHQPA